MLFHQRRVVLAVSPQADRRRASRYDVCLPIEVSTCDGVPLTAEVTNISASGFRTRSPIVLAPGTKLLVRFHGRPRRAHVAWQQGEQIGCRFAREMTPAQLADALRG
ncbi:MAG: PilZ protein [Sphingomonas bacterium]|nr:PilZ protein [Sphingomonas bacterium]